MSKVPANFMENHVSKNAYSVVIERQQ